MDQFLRPRSIVFYDEVTDAAVRLLACTGSSRLSIGVVASGMGMTRQGLTERLRISMEDARRVAPPAAYLHEIVLGRFGVRFTDWMTRSMRATGDLRPRLALPETPDECAAVRIWLALREVARCDWCDGEPGAAREVAAVLGELRQCVQVRLQSWSGRRIGAGQIRGLLAVTDGVQVAMADPVDPLPLSVGRALLDRELARLGPGPAASAA